MPLAQIPYGSSEMFKVDTLIIKTVSYHITITRGYYLQSFPLAHIPKGTVESPLVDKHIRNQAP